MQKLMIILLVLAGCAASAGAAAVQRIRLDAPLVNPRTTEAQGQAAELLDTMAGVTNRLYGDRIQCARAEAGGSFDYSLSLIASLGPDNPSVVMRIKRISDGAESAAYPWVGQPTPELPSLFAHAVFMLWGSMTGMTQQASAPAPRAVDELPGRADFPICVSVVPGNTAEREPSCRAWQRLRGAGSFNARGGRAGQKPGRHRRCQLRTRSLRHPRRHGAPETGPGKQPVPR